MALNLVIYGEAPLHTPTAASAGTAKLRSSAALIMLHLLSGSHRSTSSSAKIGNNSPSRAGYAHSSSKRTLSTAPSIPSPTRDTGAGAHSAFAARRRGRDVLDDVDVEEPAPDERREARRDEVVHGVERLGEHVLAAARADGDGGGGEAREALERAQERGPVDAVGKVCAERAGVPADVEHEAQGAKRRVQVREQRRDGAEAPLALVREEVAG
ncbi:uncharacterized protein PHACADRAFT_260363 [Phanerochaete carnosa HHB-10118-sp]|uniref:Uncharacterized protein n=1 Tax=Phanerochaete carnosa (strain HHB-10118-sp) TaxID=650164 RepID=K5WTT7_PHACS|nr:uncharacterized protein PHACADRAFT_260363 [Phanerochaete carnosa HHB-10118-sp]EKM53822.1 hypothetical protein PHACADRAFT_260363 [Phanerochaete carnosa HHB-10118-sp]